jgi:hypothetical protein
MRKYVCSQSKQVKLITLRWLLKEGIFKGKGFSSIAETNEQKARHFQMKTHNRRLSLQENQEVSCPKLSYGHQILYLKAGRMRHKYD